MGNAGIVPHQPSICKLLQETTHQKTHSPRLMKSSRWRRRCSPSSTSSHTSVVNWRHFSRGGKQVDSYSNFPRGSASRSGGTSARTGVSSWWWRDLGGGGGGGGLVYETLRNKASRKDAARSSYVYIHLTRGWKLIWSLVCLWQLL